MKGSLLEFSCLWQSRSYKLIDDLMGSGANGSWRPGKGPGIWCPKVLHFADLWWQSGGCAKNGRLPSSVLVHSSHELEVEAFALLQVTCCHTPQQICQVNPWCRTFLSIKCLNVQTERERDRDLVLARTQMEGSALNAQHFPTR